jgi:hypothetical protein
MAIYRGPGGSGDATGDSANQAQIALDFATQAGVSAAAAAASAVTAGNAATAAQTAQTNAETAETNAETAETNAETAQTAAEAAQVAAEAAQALAEAAQTAAELAETNAETAEASAISAAATSVAASVTATSASATAVAAATTATGAATAAEAARDAALAAYDNFDDRYLGQKSSDPTLDNDGDALVAGALYFNTVDNAMRVYTGTVWVDAYAAGQTFLAKANNLSDLTNAATARQNLDLEIGVDVQAYDATILKSADIGVTVQGYDANILKSGDIGVSVQGYDADTVKYDDVNPSFTDTGAIKIPVGTELQRPGTPVAGQLRFNDDEDAFEGYNGTAWAPVGGGNSTTNGLWENSNTISANYTIGTNFNAMSAGPVTVDSGVTVTVPTGSRWVVL